MQQQTGGDDKGNFQKIGEGLGGLMGQAADTLSGMLGGMMNNMGGWWAQNARQAGGGGFSASFSSDRDQECRRHFEGRAEGGVRSYDDARPLYQLGHMAGQNPDYQGRSFDQVEMELERGWGEEQQRRFGSWPEVRGFVEFGYRGRSGSAQGGTGRGTTADSTGYRASGGEGGSAGFQASGEVRSDRGGRSGESGGFQASGEVRSDRGSASGGFSASGGTDPSRDIDRTEL